MLGSGLISILKNGGYLMGSNWLEYGLRIIYTFALARFLGPELYGTWAYGLAAYGLAIGLIGFGIDSLIPIRLGADKRNAADYIGLTVTLRFALLGLAAGGLAIYAFAGEPDKTSQIVLLILIPAVAGRGLAVLARICFVTYERVGTYVKFAAVIRIAEVCVGIALLFAGGSLFNIVILHSLSWLIEGLLGLRLIHTRLTAWKPRFDKHEASKLLKQGAVLGLTGALLTWLFAGPLILVKHYTETAAQVGQLAIPLNVTMILITSAQAYLATAFPVLSRSLKRRDPRVASYGWITAVVGAMIGVAIGVIGIYFGDPALVWALGPEFEVAGTLLGPFLFIGGFILAPTGYAQILLLNGYRWHGVLANGCGGLVLLIALPPALTLWNLEGAVAATGLAWLSRASLLIACGLIFPKNYGHTDT